MSISDNAHWKPLKTQNLNDQMDAQNIIDDASCIITNRFEVFQIESVCITKYKYWSSCNFELIFLWVCNAFECALLMRPYRMHCAGALSHRLFFSLSFYSSLCPVSISITFAQRFFYSLFRMVNEKCIWKKILYISMREWQYKWFVFHFPLFGLAWKSPKDESVKCTRN